MSDPDMISAQENEANLRGVFRPGAEFVFNGIEYVSEISEKPRVQQGGGEPRTDVFVRANPSGHGHKLTLKISLKLPGWEFLVNHMSREDAMDIFRHDYAEKIGGYLQQSRALLMEQPVIDLGGGGRKIIGRMGDGSITMGWEMMITNRERGLSLGILEEEYVREVCLGERMEERRRNAIVGNTIIRNSGVPTHVVEMVVNENTTPRDVFENMLGVEEFITNYSRRCRVILKANNYRSLSNKTSSGRMDGRRNLFVQNMWRVEDACLARDLIFDAPFETNHAPRDSLENSLTELRIDVRSVVLDDIRPCHDVPENHQ